MTAHQAQAYFVKLLQREHEYCIGLQTSITGVPTLMHIHNLHVKCCLCEFFDCLDPKFLNWGKFLLKIRVCHSGKLAPRINNPLAISYSQQLVLSILPIFILLHEQQQQLFDVSLLLLTTNIAIQDYSQLASQLCLISVSMPGQNSAYRYELRTRFSISVAMHATWKNNLHAFKANTL